MEQEEQRLAILKIMGGDEYEDLDPRLLDDLYQVEEFVGFHNRDNKELRVKWINTLRDVVARDVPKNKSGTPLVSDVDLMAAPAIKRAEALLKTLKLWKVSK